ncbi:MAG: ribosome-binding factor A [bacterium]
MSERIRQVNEEIKKAVGIFLQRDLSDPAGLITVIAVETTPDLKRALVWYGYLGTKPEKYVAEILKKERGACQKYVNSVLHLRFLPRIEFRYDTSGDYAQKISEIIRNIDQ